MAKTAENLKYAFWLGKKFSTETRVKMREARLKNPVSYWRGKKLSKEHKRNISESLVGNNYCLNKNWEVPHRRNPEKNFLLALRRSSGMAKWRREVFRRDNFTCQICGIRGGKIHADHIKPFSKFPELRMELLNGRTLCVSCHKTTDTYGWHSSRNSQKLIRQYV